MRARTQHWASAATVGLVLVGVAGCGGHGSSGAAAQIRSAWVTFFSPDSSTQQKIRLLENGSQFAGTIDTIDQSSLNRQIRATVSAVAVDGPNATVTYTLERGDRPLLEHQHGRAVRVGGVWKVSETTFCSLVVQAFPRPPQCPAPGGAATGLAPSSPST